MRAHAGSLATRMRGHGEHAWLALLVAVGAAAHAVNMFNYPFYQQDEGTYVSQGWAVFHMGQLAPYTYWYDHPPLGWMQIGALTQLLSFPNSIESGRMVMLLFQVGALVLLYAVARGLGRSVWAATALTLAFALSPYGIIFHRRVLLDNVAAFWLLASLAPLARRRLTLSSVWLSGLLLGIGILSKEIDVVVVPALALLVAARADRSQRWLAVTGWLGVAGSLASLWVVYAVLKGELLPPGLPLTGSQPHVSLLGTIASQAARGADGGLLSPASQFRQTAASWLTLDPVLVGGGTIASVLAVVLIRWQRSAGAIGLAVLSVWLFLGRGGETLDFYLIPVLPLLALEVGWLLDLVRVLVLRTVSGVLGLIRAAQAALGRHRWRPQPALPRMAAAGAPRSRLTGLRMASVGRQSSGPARHLGLRNLASAFAVVLALAIGLGSLARVSNAALLWTSRDATTQRAAVDWVRTTIPAHAGVVVDMYAWLDLHAPSRAGPSLANAQYYWKVEEDPQIRRDDFGNDWRNVDYVMATPDMVGDAGHLPFLASVLAHADPVTRFSAGGWPVTIERTRAVQTWPIAADQLLQREWASWIGRFLVGGRVVVDGSPSAQAEVEANALQQSVAMDDRATFNALWAWTRANVLGRDGLSRLPGVDADIAVALLSAARRWGDPSITAAAAATVSAIWTDETAAIRGGRVAVAGGSGTARAAGGHLIVDSSGLAPAAYRLFAAADPAHRWSDVVDGTYAILAALRADGQTGGAVGVVPHWIAVDPKTGSLGLPKSTAGDANTFDAEASTLAWRIGLDALWNRDPRAVETLTWLDAPAARAAAGGTAVADAYRLDGLPASSTTSLRTSTAVLPSLLLGPPGEEVAGRLFTTAILAPTLAPGSNPPGAADLSWAWFATALMDGGLVAPTSPGTAMDWRAALGQAGSPAATATGRTAGSLP